MIKGRWTIKWKKIDKLGTPPPVLTPDQLLFLSPVTPFLSLPPPLPGLVTQKAGKWAPEMLGGG